MIEKKEKKNTKDNKTKNKKLQNQTISSQPSNVKKEDQEKNIESVLLYPITTEKIINLIESQNQLVFATKIWATKKQIKEEFEKQFKVKVKKINTKISQKGVKHAYIKLKEGKADDIAAQLKII